MKISKLACLAVAGLAILASGAAYADMVMGKVSKADAAGNAITISKADGTTATVKVSATTAYKGTVKSLADVAEGQSVTLEATKDAVTGDWSAQSVEVA